MINDFIAQYAPATRETYGHILTDFTALVGVPVEDATQADVVAYDRALAEQASATRHKKLACLRSFYLYLNKRGYRADNPAMIVRMPKVDHLRSVRYLTMDEVDKVMESFSDTKKDLRDRALMTVFLHGLRISEVLGLNVEDYREGTLRVVGKGDKMRIVPLSLEAQGHLASYLRYRKSGPMFLSMRRHADRIERRALRDVVYEVTERAGTRVHPHALRHTCGTQMMRRTGRLDLVQAMLGHADPKTTMIYAHLDTSDLQRAVEQSTLLGQQRELRLVEEIA